MSTESDGRIAADELVDGEPHVLIDGVHAVDLKLIEKGKKNYCAYKFCPFAAELADTSCGERSARTQAGRAKAQSFCIHPACHRFYHPTCYAIVHRLIEPSPTLLAPKRQRQKTDAEE